MLSYFINNNVYACDKVVYYGETAYWVNVDIDVPLFLPIYGQRRQYDLRKIAYREIHENFRIDGQMNFDSGWEWGYWLSDFVTARASWDPILSKDIHNTDYSPMSDQYEAFSKALLPFTSLYGESIGNRLNDLIVALTISQEELIIFGNVKNETCPNVKILSGFSYLSGDDTWTDVPRMFGMALLQSDKVTLKDVNDPLWPYVITLLKLMESEFTGYAMKMKEIIHDAVELSSLPTSCVGTCTLDGFNELTNDSEVKNEFYLINEASMSLLNEIYDCLLLLSMRASHVRMLYESMDPVISPLISQKANLQRQSRQVINNASEIVIRRESYYRVPWQRIASWRENPTVYRYGYLWSVHSLYYWWRDQGLAEGGSLQSEHSPCYLNRIDASEVAIGWGKYTLEILRSFINWLSPFLTGHPFEIVNCVSPPSNEYEFPRDLYPM